MRASSLSKIGQVQTKAPVVIPAARGTIFDSMGSPLALGEQATTVYVDPHEVRNPVREARVAAHVLGLKANDVYRAITVKPTHFSYVERKADPSRPRGSRTEARRLPLLRRGAADLPAAHRCRARCSASPASTTQGLSGLELQLNSELTGRPGEQTIVQDPFGRAISIAHTVAAKPGKAVFLTLDHTIQANAEQVLRQTIAQWGAKHATAIVLDPKTGGILAMAEAPTHDANASATKGLQTNHAVTDVFEPGSVFKVVTIAGALSEKLVTPQTRFTLPYSIQVADRRIHDAEQRGTETMSVSQILQRSSNVGTVTIARTLLGESHLKKWMKRFGFGERTGIDFPGESAGLAAVVLVGLDDRQRADRPGRVRHRDSARVGVRGDREQGPVGAAAPRRPRPGREAARAEDAADALAVRRPDAPADAEGRRLGRRHRAGGGDPRLQRRRQDGTAQVPGPHGYEPGKYVATFVGMVPASDPRLVVLVSVDEPTRAIFGGIVAAPAFAKIAGFDLQYLEVPPDLDVR